MKQLREFLSNIVLDTYYLPLTLESLNKESWLPGAKAKGPGVNGFFTGQLQFPKNAWVLLDETQLQTGQLNQTGILNVNAIQRLVLESNITCDMEYSTVSLDSQIHPLIVSQGKSMFPVSLDD